MALTKKENERMEDILADIHSANISVSELDEATRKEYDLLAGRWIEYGIEQGDQ